MKSFYTAVVELRQTFDDGIETHPYECGWADEAIFFVENHDADRGTVVALRAQISPDGVRWLDEGTRITIERSGFLRLRHFGGFIRLVGTAQSTDGAQASVTVSVRLALKG
ncbi:MAG: DUF6385 domain-containing protein [Microbacterium sp.]